MVMCFLFMPDGSSLFELPVPEDFAWHCMFAALNRDLKLRMIKAPLPAGLFLFFDLYNFRFRALLN